MTTTIVFEERTGAANPVRNVDPGLQSAPAFGDIDGDGDLDLVVGQFAQGQTVTFYLNTGTAWVPRFSHRTGSSSPFNGVGLGQAVSTTPTLADMDADGDLDLVMGDAGGDLNYFENTGTATAPAFTWRANGANPFNGIDVGEESAPAVADLDGDGDLDLVVGNEDGAVRYFVNSGTATAMKFTENPRGGVTGPNSPFAGIDVNGADDHGRAAPILIDLDRDGDLDLVVGLHGPNGGRIGGFQYYENTGSATAPAFTARSGADNPLDGFATNNFDHLFTKPAAGDLDGDGAPELVLGSRGETLTGIPLRYIDGAGPAETGQPFAPLTYHEAAVNPFRGIDAGERAVPTFADLDQDGDLDLVIGAADGTLGYYRNIGNVAVPRFVEAKMGATNPLDGIDVDGTANEGYAAPAFADLDRDGDLDLVVGKKNGVLDYYRNTGNATAPRFEAQLGSNNPLNGVDVDGTANEGYAAPAFADLDWDGDLDLVVGNKEGKFVHFTNTGSATAAVFTRQRGAANPLNGFDVDGTTDAGYAAPAFADLDRDGDLDLLAGKGDGFFRYYENIGTAAAPTFMEQVDGYNPLNGVDAGDNSVPAFMDMDGDGLLELVVGVGAGTLSYHRVVASRKIYTHDAAGRVVRTVFDDDNNGAVERGILDPDGDGEPDGFEFYTVNEDGLRTEKRVVDLPAAFTAAADADNPFSGIDVGRESAPAFGDMDGDGDLDLVVGENDGNLNYYRQNAAGGFAARTGADNPFNDIDVGGDSGPVLGDLDGDGDLDLFVGNNGGFVRYYRNNGNVGSPSFSTTATEGFVFSNRDLGEDPKPALGDLDGDGDLDLLVARETYQVPGTIYYYKNIGNAAVPEFERQTGAADPFRGIEDGNVAPTLVDWDRDGDLDLVIGERGGFLRYFESSGGTAPVFTERTGAANPVNGVNVGEDSVPTFGDMDGDGVLDLVVGRDDGSRAGTLSYYQGAITSRESYTLNDDGEVIRTDFDDGANGTVDRIEFYTRNAAGVIIQTDFDDDADNTLDRTERRIEIDENENGTPERIDVDTDLDGNIDRSEFDANEDETVERIEFYMRNSFGRIIQTDFDDDADRIIDRAAFDTDDNGTVDRAETYTYDDQGRRSKREIDDDNDNAEGAYDRIETYLYEGTTDRVIETRFDDDADETDDRAVIVDGTTERLEVYTYNVAGGLIRKEIDDGNDNDNADGVYDRIEIYTRVGTGPITETEFDADADGTANRIETYARNGAGDVIQTDIDEDADMTVDRREFDADSDGTAERTEYDDEDDGTVDRTKYDTDDDGTADRTEFDTDGDGRTDRSEFDRDNDGTLERLELDADDDGTVNRIEINANDNAVSERIELDEDDDGDIDKIEFDTDEDGTTNRIETYARNGAGDVIQTDIDADADDTVDRRDFDADSDGTAERIEVDDDDDGTVDYTEYDTDDDGTANRREYDADADDTAERIEYDDDDDGTVDRTRFDANDDGTIDRAVFVDGTTERLEVYTYNIVGGLIKKEIDDGNDNAPGVFDRIETYARVGVGPVTRTEFDTDADGTVDRREFDANANGVTERVEIDEDDDGDIDKVEIDANENGHAERIEYDRDNDGVLERLELDTDDDGTVNRIEINANDNAVAERIALDADDDGDIDQVEFDTDEDGAAERTEFDDDDDDRVDRTEFDADEDGTVDRLEVYAYNTAGGLIRKEIDDGNDNAPGVFDRIETYARAGVGPVTRTEFDTDADGTADRREFDADSDGRAERTEFDTDDDGTADHTEFDEDEDGNADRTEFDADGDGTAERSETYTYDARGRLSRTQFDAGDDGSFDSSETYTRNAAGDVVRTDFDAGNDGAVDRVALDAAGDGVVDEYRYDNDADGAFDWIGYDSDADGMIDRLEFHWEWGAARPVVHALALLGDGPAYTVAFYDGAGAQLAAGWRATALGAALDGFDYAAGRDVVSELQAVALDPAAGDPGTTLPVDAVLLAGVPQINLAGAGAGSTDLTISDAALTVLAAGDSNYQLRIDGDSDDTLRFDMDDFTVGDVVTIDSESYRQYAGATGNFIVDPDVALADV